MDLVEMDSLNAVLSARAMSYDSCNLNPLLIRYHVRKRNETPNLQLIGGLAIDSDQSKLFITRGPEAVGQLI